MCDYEFADPAIVRAIYHPDSPLEGRDMLLEARFCGLRFRFGVRVGGVIDETRTDRRPRGTRLGLELRHAPGPPRDGPDGLRGLEVDATTASVDFRIHVVSRAARIRNPVIRLGFRIFGRGQQVRFAKRACERMACLLAGEPRVRRSGEIAVVAGVARPSRPTPADAGRLPARVGTGLP